MNDNVVRIVVDKYVLNEVKYLLEDITKDYAIKGNVIIFNNEEEADKVCDELTINGFDYDVY